MPEVAEDIRLVIGEATANCVKHGCAQYADIEVKSGKTGLVVYMKSFSNCLKGTIEERLADTSIPPLTKEDGRGLFLTQALTKSAVVDEEGGLRLLFEAQPKST